ncbi:hypothetical protein GCM10020331_009200 [Ectobacillus funiculus]
MAALALQAGFGVIGGLAAGLATGIVVGLINGLLITKVVIPSFLVTLGMMGIVKRIGNVDYGYSSSTDSGSNI